MLSAMTKTIDFKFIPKQVHFIIEAVEAHIKKYEAELKQDSISEDRHADIANELMLLKPTLEELKQGIGNYKENIIPKQ